MTDPSRFSHLAGHVALDLANTVHWRLDDERRTDTLLGFDDVLAWAAEADVIDAREYEALRLAASRAPQQAATEWEQMRDLREAVYAAVAAPDTAGATVARHHGEAVRSAALATSEEAAHWSWELPLDLRLPRLRASFLVIDLLTTEAHARFHRCHDDFCGWVFVDRSPKHNRRWCSSADCGNRNRVRAHSERVRARQS